MTVSALVTVGLFAAGPAADTPFHTTIPQALDVVPTDAPSDHTVGLVPAATEPPRTLRAMTPFADGFPLFGGTMPLRDVPLPSTGGALGIPELVLAAYRNAELALHTTAPDCGLSWHLLAGIGHVESGHAAGGRTDAAGTTLSPIYGPVLDGHLPGNEIVTSTDGGYVRAVGPMQFLPGTWARYATDGNGDGAADPHNIFDAALTAGKYLCDDGANLHDPRQELRAVLRYNNSMTYAATVLGWSTAYKTGATPTPVVVPPDLVPPGTLPPPSAPDMAATGTTDPAPTTEDPPPAPAVPPAPSQMMILIPGLPPIPCGILCPPPPPPVDPCEPVVVPAPMPTPRVFGPFGPRRDLTDQHAVASPDAQSAADPDPMHPPAELRRSRPEPIPGCLGPQEQPQPHRQPDPQATQPQTPTPESDPARPVEPPPAPAITLPFGIVIPLPASGSAWLEE